MRLEELTPKWISLVAYSTDAHPAGVTLLPPSLTPKQTEGDGDERDWDKRTGDPRVGRARPPHRHGGDDHAFREGGQRTADDTPVGVHDRRGAGVRGDHDRGPVFHRAHYRRQVVLCRRTRAPEPRVVRQEHEQVGAALDRAAGEIGEEALPADECAGTHAVGQREDPRLVPGRDREAWGHEPSWPRHERYERQVLGERHETHLPVWLAEGTVREHQIRRVVHL